MGGYCVAWLGMATYRFPLKWRLRNSLATKVYKKCRYKRLHILLLYWYYIEALPGGFHVACLNFKTSRVSVYKCLSLIVSFAITVAIWPREVVSCRDFILRAVATFWAMSLFGIYPGRTSTFYKKNWWLKLNNIISIFKTCFGPESIDRNSNILKFFSHTKDTHRHSILCHCVS